MAIKMEYDPNDSTWKPTVNIIRDTTDADEWTPHPDWPDIKYILQNDTYGYAGSFIELITDDYDTISLSGGVAYRTSDGAYYTSATVTHTWDKSKDVPCARGYKTRWVITYLSSDTFPLYRSGRTSLLWQVYNCDTNSTCLRYAYICEAVEFINSKTLLPLSTTVGSEQQSMAYQARELVKFPPIDFNNITGAIDNLFYTCAKIKELTVLNLSSEITSFKYCFSGLNSVVKINGVIDCTSVTNIYFNYLYMLRTIYIKNLKISLNLSDSIFLTHASLLYLLQNLQTVTAGSQTLTLGATNLAKLTDTEKALATDKGWLLA